MSIGTIAMILVGLAVTGAVIAMCVVCLGFALGWFRMGAGKSGPRREVTLTMDASKIREDEEILLDRINDLGHRENEPLAVSGVTAQKTKTQFQKQ